MKNNIDCVNRSLCIQGKGVQVSKSSVNLPSFFIRRGSSVGLYFICVSTNRWDAKRKQKLKTDVRTVGTIPNYEKTGKILFKEEFIEEYPILKEGYVYRQDDGKYVFVYAPPEELLNNYLNYADVVNQKRGRPSSSSDKPTKVKPLADGITKAIGPICVFTSLAFDYGIFSNLKQIYGKADTSKILSLAVCEICNLSQDTSLSYTSWSAFNFALNLEPMSNEDVTSLLVKISSSPAKFTNYQKCFAKTLSQDSSIPANLLDLNLLQSIDIQYKFPFYAVSLYGFDYLTLALSPVVFSQSKTGMPLAIFTNQGNTIEQKEVVNQVNCIGDILSFCKKIKVDQSKTLVVLDQGVIDLSAIKELVNNKLNFICHCPLSECKWLTGLFSYDKVDVVQDDGLDLRSKFKGMHYQELVLDDCKQVVYACVYHDFVQESSLLSYISKQCFLLIQWLNGSVNPNVLNDLTAEQQSLFARFISYDANLGKYVVKIPLIRDFAHSQSCKVLATNIKGLLVEDIYDLYCSLASNEVFDYQSRSSRAFQQALQQTPKEQLIGRCLLDLVKLQLLTALNEQISKAKKLTPSVCLDRLSIQNTVVMLNSIVAEVVNGELKVKPFAKEQQEYLSALNYLIPINIGIKGRYLLVNPRVEA